MTDELFEGLSIKNGIFDSHAHYCDEKFDGIRDELLKRLNNCGIEGIITCGTDIESSWDDAKLAEKYPFVYSAAGYHPENIEGLDYDEAALIELLSHKKTVAIGEIGLDYHWDTDRDIQKYFFEKQLALSKRLNIPVIVHDREAHADTLALLQKYNPMGVVHCFSGSVEMAKEILKIGMFIGVGGVVTFKNARKTVEVAEMLPLDKLLLETDCPYLAPVPYRGKICHSGHISLVAQKIAEIKGITADEVILNATANTKRLFSRIP